MIHLLWRPPWWAFAVGGHVGNPTGWEVAVDVVAAVNRRAGALVLGWGWDAHVPLRPWPRVWWGYNIPRGNVTAGVAWLGLFLNVGTYPVWRSL